MTAKNKKNRKCSTKTEVLKFDIEFIGFILFNVYYLLIEIKRSFLFYLKVMRLFPYVSF